MAPDVTAAYTRDYPSYSPSARTIDPPSIAFGPGDCVCVDFEDPAQLQGVNLPKNLRKLVKSWSSKTPDPYSDLDSASASSDQYDSPSTTSGYDSDSGSGSDTRRRSKREPKRDRGGRRQYVNGDGDPREIITRHVDRDKPDDTGNGEREEIVIRRPDREQRDDPGTGEAREAIIQRPERPERDRRETPGTRDARDLIIQRGEREREQRRERRRDDSVSSGGADATRREDYYYGGDGKPDAGPTGRGDDRSGYPIYGTGSGLRGRSRRRQISCLAFGSREGEFAMIYQEKGHWYLDGNIFSRLSTLQDWIIPDISKRSSVGRSRITTRWGSDIHIFLGPENSFFAYDEGSYQFTHNIQTREFRDWVDKCTARDRHGAMGAVPSLKRSCAPRCLALGPNDMYCWISEDDYSVNHAFRKAFPSIEKFLRFAKHKRMLQQVTFNTSSYTQSGSKLPYYMLTTKSGINLSSVPGSAIEIVSAATTRWSALLAATRRPEPPLPPLPPDGEGGGRPPPVRDPRLYDDEDTPIALSKQLSQQLSAVATLAFPKAAKETANTASVFDLTRWLTGELEKITKDVNAHPVPADNVEWTSKNISDKVHLVIEDLSADGTATARPDEDDVRQLLLDIFSPQVPIAEVISKHGLKADSAPQLEQLRTIVSDIQRTEDSVDLITRNDPSKEDMSLADKIQIILTDYVAKEAELSSIEKSVAAAVGDDELVSKMALAEKVQALAADQMLKAQELAKIEKAMHDFTGGDKGDKVIAKLSLPEKIQALIADDLAKGQQLARDEKVLREASELVGHLKDTGDAARKLKELLKRK